MSKTSVIWETGDGYKRYCVERFFVGDWRTAPHWKILKQFDNESDAIADARRRSARYANIEYRVVQDMQGEETK